MVGVILKPAIACCTLTSINPLFRRHRWLGTSVRVIRILARSESSIYGQTRPMVRSWPRPWKMNSDQQTGCFSFRKTYKSCLDERISLNRLFALLFERELAGSYMFL